MIERLSSKLIKSGDTIYHWCPACDCAHGYQVPRWKFNGNNLKPSFTPSMKLFTQKFDQATQKYGKEITVCHFFVTDGEIRYCGDCPHPFKDKVVPLPDFPSGYSLSGDVT